MFKISLYDNSCEGEPVLIKEIVYHGIPWGSKHGDKDFSVKELGKKFEALMDEIVNS